MSFSKCEPKSFYVLLAKEKFKLRRKIKKIVHFICIKVSKNYYAIEVCFIVGKNRKYTTGIKLIESLHKDLEQISCPMSISGDFVKFFRNSVKLSNSLFHVNFFQVRRELIFHFTTLNCIQLIFVKL